MGRNKIDNRIFDHVKDSIPMKLEPRDLHHFMPYVLEDFEWLVECEGKVFWQNQEAIPNYKSRWYEWEGWVIDCGTGAFKDFPQIVSKNNRVVRYVADEVRFPNPPSEEFIIKVKTKSLYGVQTKRLSGGSFT